MPSIAVQAAMCAALLAHGGNSFASCAKDGPRKALVDGGVVVSTQDADYELVARQDTLHLYVRARGTPVDIFETKARLTLIAGRARQVVEMSPVPGRLEARGSFQVAPGTRVVAVVSRPGKSTATLRFAPLE